MKTKGIFYVWFKNLFNCGPTEIQAYRFTRLAIRKHDENIDGEFARIVRNNFYVDDMNCVVNDFEEDFDL